LKAHFSNGVGRYGRRDVLPAYRQGHLRHQAADPEVRHPPDQLVAAADRAEIGPALAYVSALRDTVEELVDFFFGNSMVAAGGPDRRELLLVDPLLQSGVANPEYLGSIARGQELGISHFFPMSMFLAYLDGLRQPFGDGRVGPTCVSPDTPGGSIESHGTGHIDSPIGQSYPQFDAEFNPTKGLL